jgi:alkaline phosphatase D
MPIRTGVNGDQSAIFRSFKIGDLADLHMLDTRLHGRDQGLEYAKDLTYESITFDIRERSIPRAITTDEAAELKPEHTRRFFLPYDYSGKQPVAITDYQKILDLKPRAMPDGWGYSPDVDAFRKQKLDSPARTLLGHDQEQWLADVLRSGQKRGSKWQIIGQQVLMGRTGIPKLTIDFKGKPREYVAFVRLLQSLERLGLPFNLDAWDGYPASRQRVYKELLETSANPIVLSGDTHNAWAFNLTDDEGLSVGVEIGTPGITSPGLETDSTTKPDEMSAALMLASPELIEVDTSRRGWAELVITPTQTSNQWHFVDTILSRDFTVSSSVPLICKLGDKKFSAS